MIFASSSVCVTCDTGGELVGNVFDVATQFRQLVVDGGGRGVAK